MLETKGFLYIKIKIRMTNPKKIILSLAVLISAISLLITACKKDNSSGSEQQPKKLSVYLTDDPCMYDSVFVDIRYVEVKIDTSDEHMNDNHFDDHDSDADDDHQDHDQFGKWDTLGITPGVYNIMKLRNGVDALLGTANLPKGSIRKIRLTLGTNNSVIISGISHLLNLYTGTTNYVYVKIHEDDEDDDDTTECSIWLDFHICESIIQDNGQYYLKPFIKPFCMDKSGVIEGIVLPGAAHPLVKAYTSSDTSTAIPEEDGEYKIRGLKEGTYKLLFRGFNGYKDSLISNIQVKKGEETKVPLITLKK